MMILRANVEDEISLELVKTRKRLISAAVRHRDRVVAAGVSLEVATRMLTALVSFVILGLCMIYVDDIHAVSTYSTVARDMTQADETLLLVDKVVAKHKDEWLCFHLVKVMYD
ncbi:hypothetical protein B484DRAFT_393994 [Ochromonadaceae sp. CCMP2298]|nr:hypothetical protein B484DRAFT_393994 [Ochromonadaceae sp. CCMP2298]